MSQLAELKRLLLGEEQKSLQDLRERVLNRAERAKSVADVLPDSVLLGNEKGGRLTKALQEPVRECLRLSIKKEPKVFADALFPVMGPAIRKAITESLKSLMQSLNQALEHSTSPQGLRWRIEAWRTGVPFSEVVLKHTLLYRVEEVFLIQRESGLLIEQVSHSDVNAQDRDAVSAMLTAIQDFVRDSFARGGSSDLETVDIGEDTVWVVYSPDLMLACVIRGVPPLELRQEFRAVLNRIRTDYAEDLEGFDGDASPMLGLRELLEKCLRLEQRDDAAATRKKKSSLSLPVLIIGIALLALLAYWAVSTWRESRRIADLEHALADTPGIVVVAMNGENGELLVKGLRDPLSASPRQLATERGFAPDEVRFDLARYQSMEPSIVSRRAAAWLDPPANVVLELANDTLSVRGETSLGWVERVQRLGRYLPGIGTLDSAGLRPDQKSVLDRAREQLAPPVGVELALDGTSLSAAGIAPAAWIDGVRTSNITIPYVDEINLAAVSTVEQSRLSRARAALAPPDSIQLSLRDDTVRAVGEAPPMWIERARGIDASSIGLETIDLSAVQPDERSLMRYIAAQLLPPESAALDLRQGTLVVDGSAPWSWLVTLRGKAREIEWISAVDADRIVASEWMEAQALAKRVNARSVFFENTTDLTPDSVAALGASAADLQRITEFAAIMQTEFRLTLTGHTDGTGIEALNAPLRIQRADKVRQRLRQAGIDDRFVRVAAGPSPSGEALKSLGERRVDFLVELAPPINP